MHTVHTYIHTYIYTYIHTYIHTEHAYSTYIHTFICTYILYIHTYIHTVHAHSTYILTYIYIHTYIYTLLSAVPVRSTQSQRGGPGSLLPHDGSRQLRPRFSGQVPLLVKLEYLCMYVCMYVCICTTCIHTYIYVHTNAIMCMCPRWVESLDKVGESSGALGNALIYVVSGAYLISGLNVCMYICIYVCMHVCMQVLIHATHLK